VANAVTGPRRLRPAPLAILAGLIVAAAVFGAFHNTFKDLLVYEFGGQAALDGRPLYESREPANGLGFTYPPFAAVAMAPLALIPTQVAAALWTGASMGALAASLAISRRALGRPAPASLTAALALGALALQPVWQTFAFGQINLLVMLAILVELLRPERRFGGVLIGVAAGVKLTPLAFVVLLALVGRRREAGRAALVFAATVVVGFAAAPGSSAAYWTDGLLDASRVGPPALAHNQSVYGALTRLLDGTPSTALWLAVAAPVAVAALLAAAAWWRRGDRLLGVGLGAVAMLIASPVSWAHHWVWAAPIALLLWERSRWAAIAWAAVFTARPMTWPSWGDGREYAWSPLDHVVGNAYLLAALALAVWSTWTWLRLRAVEARAGDPVRASTVVPCIADCWFS
jgi:alpha-1,2-mannosyltransferase